MKKIEIMIDYRCNKCFPEIKTEKEYQSNYMFQSIIITDGKKEYSNRIVCPKCGEWLGNYIVKKEVKH